MKNMIICCVIALLMVTGCNNTETRELHNELVQHEIPMPANWGPLFANASKVSVTDTVQIPEAGIVRIEAEVLNTKSGASFITKVSITQISGKKGWIFAGRILGDPINTGTISRPLIVISGTIQAEKKGTNYNLRARVFSIGADNKVHKQ